MFESCVIPVSLEHEFIFAELPDLSFETDNFQPHSASPASQSTFRLCARVSLFLAGPTQKSPLARSPEQ